MISTTVSSDADKWDNYEQKVCRFTQYTCKDKHYDYR